MQENTPVSDSVFIPLLNTIHFYASMIAGWWLFHNGVYPLAYFAKTTGADLAAQLPIYAANVMAFGCLAYVATRPLVLLVSAVLRAFERGVTRSNIE